MSSIIKSANVRLGDAGPDEGPGAAMPSPGSRARGPHAKSVEILRVGDRVHALELVCSCGEKTLIELDYPEASSTGTD